MSPRHPYTCLGQLALALVLLGACFSDDRASQDVDAATAGENIDAATGGDRCPPETVFVSEFNVCIDRYEAAVNFTPPSQEGQMPWDWAANDEAELFCGSVGKRLCTGEEWVGACSGPSPGTVYPYGNTYDPDACGGIESTLPGGLHDTGTLPKCEGGYPGIFDMSANVWEWTATCTDTTCMIRGGGELSDEIGARCDSSVAVPKQNATGFGFRCCMSPPPAGR